MELIDPKTFGLNVNVKIKETENSFTIIINRKSRIIMKDSERILKQIKKIQKIKLVPVNVETTAPVCNKTKLFLKSFDVKIKTIAK